MTMQSYESRPLPAGLAERDVTLVELLDRVIDKGVVLGGDLTLAVADVDLLYLGVRLLLCSVDRLPDDHPLRQP
jgi:hypothetical protein